MASGVKSLLRWSGGLSPKRTLYLLRWEGRSRRWEQVQAGCHSVLFFALNDSLTCLVVDWLLNEVVGTARPHASHPVPGQLRHLLIVVAKARTITRACHLYNIC